MLDPEIIGRYALYGKIASGGMASVHIARLLGPVGFSRTVAIKRMHAQFTGDPEFVSMFLDEARLAARIRHPNVVSTLDVVATNGELFLVLEYVQGETLSVLSRRTTARGNPIPLPIAAAIISGVLHGLHAAHEAKNERGEALNIVHRDISPQNVMVGIDGVPRVLDFGIAKAAGRLRTTHSGALKGKLSYMPAEQVRGKPATRKNDVYATAVTLWEILTGRELFHDDNEAATLQNVLTMKVNPPSAERPEVPPALDAVVMKGLARNAKDRFETAREMASALEAAVHVAIAPTVGAWVEGVAADLLSEQAGRVAEIEHASDISGPVLAASVIPLAQQPKTEPSLRRQELAVSNDTPTMAAQETSVSWPAGLPDARKRRNILVGVGTALVAGVLVVVLMQHNASVEPASAATAGPPSASTVAQARTPDPSPLPLPVAIDSADSSKSSPQPSTAKRPAKPPAGTSPSHHAPPAATTPGGYNPLDHL